MFGVNCVLGKNRSDVSTGEGERVIQNIAQHIFLSKGFDRKQRCILDRRLWDVAFLVKRKVRYELYTRLLCNLLIKVALPLNFPEFNHYR